MAENSKQTIRQSPVNSHDEHNTPEMTPIVLLANQEDSAACRSWESEGGKISNDSHEYGSHTFINP
jgi:hypothetical protein